MTWTYLSWGLPISGRLPRRYNDKEPACQSRRCRVDPWVGKIPWRRWQPTPVLLPGKPNGQRSLEGYRPRGRKESAVTDGLSTDIISGNASFTPPVLKSDGSAFNSSLFLQLSKPPVSTPEYPSCVPSLMLWSNPPASLACFPQEPQTSTFFPPSYQGLLWTQEPGWAFSNTPLKVFTWHQVLSTIQVAEGPLSLGSSLPPC